MTNEMTQKYLSDFEGVGTTHPLWLQKIRHQAMRRFGELGFPTTRQEEWRYTSVEPIIKKTFRTPETYRPDGLNPSDLDPLGCGALASIRLVFINGQWMEKFSHLEGIDGILVSSLANQLKAGDDRVKNSLTRYAPYSENPFTALNTAFISDGAFILLPKNSRFEKPIEILWYTDSKDNPLMTHPRHLIIAEEGSEATILESYFGQGSYFTNAVTEIVLGENATLHHYKLQREDEEAFHLSTIQASEGQASRFTSHSLSMGGRIARNEIRSSLNEEGAECVLNGFYLTQGNQHVDHHTLIDHIKPHGTSLELYKGILDGQSTAVFDGNIIVRPHANQTNARQTNKNLLLSNDALVNTRPLLEIHNDDVKCNHGATIGRLDETQLFYLRSRGIENQEARALLTAAFAQEVIQGVKIDPLKAYLDHELRNRLKNRRQEVS
ncbi:MAG: Fe-S cluster assembly protein SufD [Deltaproteobacteria bacterium]|nr:Fe-S cluster assembly protein SufD [Deltaproteobacteria bacterium]